MCLLARNQILRRKSQLCILTCSCFQVKHRMVGYLFIVEQNVYLNLSEVSKRSFFHRKQ